VWLLRGQKIQPLLVAVKHKLWDVCLLILDSCPVLPRPVVFAALQRAAAAGQEQLVASLIAAADEPLAPLYERGREHSWEHISLNRSLILAAGGKHYHVCSLLLQAVPQLIKARPSYEHTSKLAAGGHVEEVCLILDAFCQESPLHKDGLLGVAHAALTAAAAKGQIEVIKAMVARGVDVNGGHSCFESGGPLAQAIYNNNLELVQLLLDQGAELHAENPSYAYSALNYAAHDSRTEACRLLLSRPDAVVGRPELLAAVASGTLTLLTLLLQSEANMDPELRQDQGRRAECLGAAVAEAVGNCMHFQSRSSSGTHTYDVEMLKMLLGPPAHWGPVTPDVLDKGVLAVLRALHHQHKPPAGFLQAIELLGSAGADLGIRDGALLKTAARRHYVNHFAGIVKIILHHSPGLAIAYGVAILQDHCSAELAVLLIRAGAPVHQEPGLYERLLAAAAKYECDELLDILSL
jgi:ankyrin repeat protein